MGESGCLKDGCFQNLQIEGNITAGGGGELPFGALETRFASVTRTAANVVLVTQGLLANTHYTCDAPAPATGLVFNLTLPSRASSKKGDYITFVLRADMNGSDVMKIGTEGEDFSIGSKLYIVGEDQTRVGQFDFSIKTDDFLNITAAANGDGGAGTNFQCYYNGISWGINCEVTGIGSKTVSSVDTEFGSS